MNPFFFFFFYFFLPTASRNRKKLPLTFFSEIPRKSAQKSHLPFFPKFREKVLKNPAKRAQVSFFTNYVFSAVITRTHTHTLFY